jgi:hypothetical protein
MASVLGWKMNTSNASKQEFEDFRKIVEDLLRRVELASHRFEISFAEFQGIFGLVLRSSFVNQAAKELLQESFLRLEDRMENDLNDNENSCTNLKNWFSSYLSTPISETDDRSANKLGASNGQ